MARKVGRRWEEIIRLTLITGSASQHQNLSGFLPGPPRETVEAFIVHKSCN